MYTNLKKKHLGGGQGNPRKKCRLWQKHLTVLQARETTSLKGVGEKGAGLSDWGWVQTEEQRRRLAPHKPCTLAGPAASAAVRVTALKPLYLNTGTQRSVLDVGWGKPGFPLLQRKITDRQGGKKTGTINVFVWSVWETSVRIHV